MTTLGGRMPADQRRASLVESALEAFACGSYRGVTTADIARSGGVSEPILYRHFGCKRDLYLACLGEAWASVRALWEAVVSSEPDPKAWIAGMGRAYLAIEDSKLLVANLWVQAVTEASDDPEICDAIRNHMREVHGYVCDVIRRSQEAGGILPERDPSAEAWIFISLGLLTTVDRRVGGLLDDELPSIFASRRSWLTGEPAGPAAG